MSSLPHFARKKAMPLTVTDRNWFVWRVQHWLSALKDVGPTPGELQRAFLKHRRACIRMWELITIACSLGLGLELRFDFAVPPRELSRLWPALALALIVKLPVFLVLGIERGWWRFADFGDLCRILRSNVIGSILFTALGMLAIGSGFPRSVYLIDFLLCFLASAGGRFGVRLYHEMVITELTSTSRGKGLLIYGAGSAGLGLVREIKSNSRLNYRIVGFLDDDQRKRHSSLLGVPVMGCGRDVGNIVHRYKHTSRSVDEIVIAMPSASGRQIAEALANCRATGLPCKTIPSLGELLAGKVRVSQIREISVEDLLGREPVQLEEGRIRMAIAERTVMVTGAGGSIGSELCRQLATNGPKMLVLFDQAESDLFRIEMELNATLPSVKVVPVIGDVRQYARVEEAIQLYAVESIFHAAAYKHVPMMESHLLEAVHNNVIGTHNLVQAAFNNGVSSFVMVSSDKAVNPTNVMGLTKRISELVVSSMPTSGPHGPIRFVSVRFGNVLGSNGSVVPLFRAQIAGGGPVTVTHPEMRRYFMTIPEAVQLVLQASIMGKGSEIFVLDMGEPVRILDLARNMIRLSGHEPDVDIPIRFVGLRPGEKLSEELSAASDQMSPTCHEKIMIFRGQRLEHDTLQRWICELRELLAQRDEVEVLVHLQQIVPEYHPSGQWHSILLARQLIVRARQLQEAIVA